MIKTKSDYFAEAALCAADVILIFTIYKIWTVIENISGFGVKLMPWLIAILVIYAINALLYHKRVLVNTVMIFNIFSAIIMVLMGMFVITSPDTNASILGIIFKCGIFAFTSFWTYMVCKNGVIPSQIMLHLEFSFTTLLLVLFLRETESFSFLPFPVHVLFAAVITLVSLLIKRTDTRNSTRTYGSPTAGGLIVFGVVLLCTLCTFLFSFLFSNIVQKIVETGLKGGQSIIIIIKDSLVALLEFIVSLFPQTEMEGVIEQAPNEMPDVSYEMATELNINVMPYLAVIAVIAVLAIIIYFIVRNKNKKTDEVIVTEAVKEGLDKTPFSDILNSFLKRIEKIYKTFIFRIKNKNTIKGLYWQMDDFGKRNKMPRGEGESASEYLMRITETTSIFTNEEKENIMRLSKLFMVYFYSENKCENDLILIKKCRKIFRKTIPKHKNERIEQKNENTALQA